MAESRYDLREIYRRAFGQVGIPYPLLGVQSANLLPIGALKEIAEEYQPKEETTTREIEGSFEYNSVLGTQYLMPVKVAPKKISGNGFEDWFQMWNEPLVSLAGRNNIVSTQINGFQAKGGSRKRGEVNELVSLANYSVRIRGVIINEEDDNRYPVDQVRQLRKIVEAKLLKIDCLLTNIFGIDYIIVQDFSVPEVEGYPGLQPYEITAISDEPFEFGTVQTLSIQQL